MNNLACRLQKIKELFVEKLRDTTAGITLAVDWRGVRLIINGGGEIYGHTLDPDYLEYLTDDDIADLASEIIIHRLLQPETVND